MPEANEITYLKILNWVKKLIAERVNREPSEIIANQELVVDLGFDNGGLDSLCAEIKTTLNEVFGVTVSLNSSDCYSCVKVKDLARKIEEAIV